MLTYVGVDADVDVVAADGVVVGGIASSMSTRQFVERSDEKERGRAVEEGEVFIGVDRVRTNTR